MADGSRLGAHINHAEGLCAACARQVERAVGDLPRDYTELALLLGAVGVGEADKVSGTRELPTPIRLAVEALMGDIWHETVCWAELVAEVMRINWDTQDTRDSRRGAAVDRACALLTRATSALLALQQVVHVIWDGGTDDRGCDTWGYTPLDGVTGALRMLDLHHRARAHCGLTRSVERKTMPCPRCDAQALTHETGSELVVCGACGREYTLDEYDKLCTILVRLREAG